MAYTIYYRVDTYQFAMCAGIGAKGVLIDPSQHNLNDPECLDELQEALKAFPDIDAEAFIGDYAHNYLKWEDRADVIQKEIHRCDGDHIIAILDAYNRIDKSIYIDSIHPRIREYVNWIKEEQNHRLSGRPRTRQTSNKTKPTPMTTAGYIYLLQSPTGVYKIGRSIDPENRIKTFGLKLPFEVEYICLIETKDMVELERELHERFEEQRVNGEWFNLGDSDIAYIKALAEATA